MASHAIDERCRLSMQRQERGADAGPVARHRPKEIHPRIHRDYGANCRDLDCQSAECPAQAPRPVALGARPATRIRSTSHPPRARTTIFYVDQVQTVCRLCGVTALASPGMKLQKVR
jgi:hypothetical protein